MKKKIINKKKNSIKLEISEADHDVLHLLESQLNKDKKVLIATYRKEHPLFNKYTFLLKVKEGEDPEKIFNKAIDETIKIIKKTTKEITSQIK